MLDTAASTGLAWSTLGEVSVASEVLTKSVGETTVLLDVAQVAELLNCSPRHVYRLSDAGRMPAPLRRAATACSGRAGVLTNAEAAAADHQATPLAQHFDAFDQALAAKDSSAAMRHSDIRLTMGVYTDPKLLDVRGALDALPALPLDGTEREREVAQATGTDDPTDGQVQAVGSSLAPGLAPAWCKQVQAESIPGKGTREGAGSAVDGSVAVSAYPVKTKQPLATGVSGCLESGRQNAS